MPTGSYRLSGAKMWISAGDHELGENIVHLVLAKIVGAPAGVRGISLFIVPRWRVNADGQIVARATTCGWPVLTTRWASAAASTPF